MKYVAIVTVHLYKVASDYQSMQTTWENTAEDQEFTVNQLVVKRLEILNL